MYTCLYIYCKKHLNVDYNFSKYVVSQDQTGQNIQSNLEPCRPLSDTNMRLNSTSKATKIYT